MSIKMDDTLRGIWFVAINETTDALFGLSKIDGKCVLTYRFRYYTDKPTGDVFEDDDVKHWYAFETDGSTEAEVIDIVRTLVAKAPKQSKPFECLRLDKTLQEFIDEFMAQPFAHAKFIPASEADD